MQTASPVTKALYNHKIQYKWQYPATLLIAKNGTDHTIITLTGEIKLLYTWGIVLEQPQESSLPLS